MVARTPHYRHLTAHYPGAIHVQNAVIFLESGHGALEARYRGIPYRTPLIAGPGAMGGLLSALAVQFIFDGIAQSGIL